MRPPAPDILNTLWVEKHRPRRVEDLALSEENRALVDSFLKAGSFPHLLLVGPAGCGKTTLAQILINSVDCAVLSLNASSERGIDTVREKVGRFARAKMRGAFNTVFLDEGDRLTPDAQTALRNTMETYADVCRFIITGNYGYKIIDPIQSRCTLIELAATPLKERVRILLSIFEREGLKVDKVAALNHAERYKDLRRMINEAQRMIAATGALKSESEVVAEGQQVYDLITRRDYGGLVKLSRTAGIDHQMLLKSLFWVVPDAHPKAAQFRYIVAKAYHESVWTPDVVIQFLGTCAELIHEVV